MNKKGAMDDYLLMFYRIFLLAIVAFFVFVVFSSSYGYYVDVRDVEAALMAREVINCVFPEGVVDVDSFSQENNGELLEYCGFGKVEVDRFFVRVSVFSDGGREWELTQGDSGLVWVKDFFEKIDKEAISGKIVLYEPGYYNSSNYLGYILVDGERKQGRINLEVLVGNEF